MLPSPKQIAASKARMDRFAELLSIGLEAPEIAERMGIHRRRASQLLGELRAKYGWQAQ